MIKLNGDKLELNKFPDGTFILKEDPILYGNVKISWYYENEEELPALIYITKHLRESSLISNIDLFMPYIPNARQDRVKCSYDILSLKYFAEVINWLGFDKVTVYDPHSHVSEALINNLVVLGPQAYIGMTLEKIGTDNLIFYYPDEGAMKRYADLIKQPYVFGIKKRDWETGKILGLDVSGETDTIPGKRILIVDDICSKGGTFYHSAKKLKELGADKIYLYVTHCENTILTGELLTSGLVERVFTTNSIFTNKHEKIEVFNV